MRLIQGIDELSSFTHRLSLVEAVCNAPAIFDRKIYDFFFRYHFGKELQHMLAEHLLAERRGHKLPREIKHAELEYHQHETGQVELYEDVIKALERKHRAEMEMMVHMLQGKDASQTRADVRNMTNGKSVINKFHMFLIVKVTISYQVMGKSPSFPVSQLPISSPYSPFFFTIFTIFFHHIHHFFHHIHHFLSPYSPFFITIFTIFYHHIHHFLSPYSPFFITIFTIFFHYIHNFLSPYSPFSITIFTIFYHHIHHYFFITMFINTFFSQFTIFITYSPPVLLLYS